MSDTNAANVSATSKGEDTQLKSDPVKSEVSSATPTPGPAALVPATPAQAQNSVPAPMVSSNPQQVQIQMAFSSPQPAQAISSHPQPNQTASRNPQPMQMTYNHQHLTPMAPTGNPQPTPSSSVALNMSSVLSKVYDSSNPYRYLIPVSKINKYVCCFAFGMAAIYYSHQANASWVLGHTQPAREHATKAITFNLIGIVTGFLIIVSSIAIFLMIVFQF